MTKRAFFRRRKNGPNNDFIFGLRNFVKTFGRGPQTGPVCGLSIEPNLAGETNRQYAERRRAQVAEAAPAEKPKRVRPSRAKKVAA